MSLTLIPRNPRDPRDPRTRLRQRGWPVNFVAAREADRLFGEFFGAPGRPPSPFAAEQPRGFVPKLDVSESDDGYTVTAELPGVKQEDLEVLLEDNVLTLKGEKRDGRESEEEGARRSEMRFGSFERRVAFRSPIAEDEVKARFADGLLTIAIPKPPEERPKVRAVPVETA